MPSPPRSGTMDAREYYHRILWAHTTYWLSTASVRASPSTGSSDVGDGRRSVFTSFFVERRSRGVIIKKVSVAARTDADGRRRRRRWSEFEIRYYTAHYHSVDVQGDFFLSEKLSINHSRAMSMSYVLLFN